MAFTLTGSVQAAFGLHTGMQKMCSRQSRVAGLERVRGIEPL